jgi:3',5'-cyclic-AMP phosphodiesterase
VTLKALDGLQVPVHILPGDHDIKTGKLDDYYRCLRAEQLAHGQTFGSYRCLFLNSVDTGRKEGFDFSVAEVQWLRVELDRARRRNLETVLFMHAYPGELGTAAREVRELIREHRVLAVDIGHTHYNEVANDGHTIYASTRSTGQIEEGPVGYFNRDHRFRSGQLEVQRTRRRMADRTCNFAS